MQEAAVGKNGWSSRYVGIAKCGHRVHSLNELMLCNWLHEHDLEHEVQVPRDTFGFCDVRCKGVWIEFDGIGRSDEYFERKYGDEPFIKLTDRKMIHEELNFLLQDKNIAAGNEIVYEKVISIEPWKETVMYDISMENEPHNFLANNIVVHNCSWLLTYYPDEWVTTYIDYCSTTKGKQTGKEDPKAVALSEAKGLGYAIGKPDINLSEREYTIQHNKLIPSFASLKYVGSSVLGEIGQFRPYKSIEELLFNADGTWRHSRFNKRALSTLIRLEAFESMDLVGEGKTFANYRQLHYVLIEKGDALKRACSKKKKTHTEELAKYIEEAKQLPDWSLEEKIVFSKELSGSVDLALIVTPEVAEYFDSQGIVSIDEREHDDQWVWCVVKNATPAKTKSEKSKDYLRMKVYGQSGQDKTVFCWNFKPAKDKPIPENSLIIGRFKESPFGYSAFFGGLEIIAR